MSASSPPGHPTALSPAPFPEGCLSPGRAGYHGQRWGGRGRGRGGRAAARSSSRRSPGRSELLQPGGSASHRDSPRPPSCQRDPRPSAGSPRGRAASCSPPAPPPRCRGRRTRTSPGAGAGPLQPGSRPSVRAGQGFPQRGGERLDRKGLTEACRVLGASPVCASQLHQPILARRSMSCM